jgi:hypothetical protein
MGLVIYLTFILTLTQTADPNPLTARHGLLAQSRVVTRWRKLLFDVGAKCLNFTFAAILDLTGK